MSIFSKVKMSRPRHNKFDLSHERKMSMQMGVLTPIMLQEILPGDRFRVNTEVFMRMAPMLAPIMHRVNVFTHYFFVPNRILWDEWEEFITGGEDGTSAPVAPFMTTTQMESGGWLQKGTVADYFGLPIVTGAAPTSPTNINALPFRAYQQIYNDYYRDQNLTAKIDFSKASGQVAAGAETARHCAGRIRCWEKDYFTSALPFAQRGAEVGVPITDDTSQITQAYEAATGNLYPTGEDVVIGAPGQVVGSVSGGMHLGADGHMINVNELRRTVRLQMWLEKMARGGARYVEQTLMQWGVKSSDARLQRAEYLGGGKTPVSIAEVLSTFQDGTGEPQGNMAGHGVSTGRTNGFKRSFEEHGFVIGIMSVLPKTAYQQGIHKMFSRADKLDYAWPDFAHLGEQEILNKELYYTETSLLPDGTFGYTPRYSEYKYGCSTVHGEFRDTLSFWHMGRIFTAAPTLNEDFVTSDPTTRIFAVTQNEHLYVHLYNKVDALRMLPYYGTPSL